MTTVRGGVEVPRDAGCVTMAAPDAETLAAGGYLGVP